MASTDYTQAQFTHGQRIFSTDYINTKFTHDQRSLHCQHHERPSKMNVNSSDVKETSITEKRLNENI